MIHCFNIDCYFLFSIFFFFSLLIYINIISITFGAIMRLVTIYESNGR